MTLRRIAKGLEKQLRIGRVGALCSLRELAVVRSALHLPRNDSLDLESASAPGITIHEVFPAHSFERKLPYFPGEEEPHWIFASEQRGTIPRAYVAEIERGRFWGFYGGSVFTEDSRLIPALSKDVWGEKLHSAFVRMNLPNPTYVPGRVLSLVTPEAATNYHHWTVDLIPRAGLASKAGYDLRSFDRVLIKDRQLPFQKEALKRLGFDESKIMRVDDKTHLTTDVLVVPSVRHDNTRVGLQEIQFTRRLYLPREPSSPPKRRLYVSRRDAAFRRVTNEPEIMPILKKFGFEEVAMSHMSVAEQAKVFSEAAVIVGPNGSALANLVFANPACRVAEFFAPGWVVNYNWMLADLLGLDFTAVIGEGERPPTGILPRDLKQDIVLDLAKFHAALEHVTRGL
ncbi:MAG: glycosyltransferase family 61 protein [Nibricoccus sp.]